MSDAQNLNSSLLRAQQESKKRHERFARRGRYVNETGRPYLYQYRGKWITILTLGPRSKVDDLAMGWAKEMNDAY